MKYLVRFLKILAAILLAGVIGIPFIVLMLFVGLFSICPIFIILYVISGDADKSSDRAFNIAMDFLWCEVGYTPLSWSRKLLND